MCLSRVFDIFSFYILVKECFFVTYLLCASVLKRIPSILVAQWFFGGGSRDCSVAFSCPIRGSLTYSTPAGCLTGTRLTWTGCISFKFLVSGLVNFKCFESSRPKELYLYAVNAGTYWFVNVAYFLVWLLVNIASNCKQCAVCSPETWLQLLLFCDWSRFEKSSGVYTGSGILG